MELMCPHCHSNNRVGTERAADAARFTCASCGMQFDAVLVEGALVTVLPREGRAAFEPPPAFRPAPADDSLDILNLPQEPFAQTAAPPSQVLEDVFVSPPAPAPPAAVPVAPARTPDEVDPLHITEAAPARPATAAARPEVVRPVMPPAPAFEPPPSAEAPAPKSVPDYDKYAVGLRVLRVSPMWLLLSSLGFFAVLLTMSWLSKPVVPVEEAVASGAKMKNQATNPSPESPAAAQVEQAKAAAEQTLPAPPPAAAKTARAETQAPAAQSFASSAGDYTVQVGSFSNASEASQHVSKLRAAGFDARAVAVELPNRGTWHRVQAGRFASRDEAAKVGARLRAKGLAAAAMVTEVR